MAALFLGFVCSAAFHAPPCSASYPERSAGGPRIANASPRAVALLAIEGSKEKETPSLKIDDTAMASIKERLDGELPEDDLDGFCEGDNCELPPLPEEESLPEVAAETEPGWVMLDSDTFFTETGYTRGAGFSGAWFVMFSAPWCAYCRKLEPTWAAVGRTLAAEGVTMAKVDGPSNEQLARRYGVMRFPTLVMLVGREEFAFNGRRDHDGLVRFAKEVVQGHWPGRRIRSVAARRRGRSAGAGSLRGAGRLGSGRSGGRRRRF